MIKAKKGVISIILLEFNNYISNGRITCVDTSIYHKISLYFDLEDNGEA